MQHCSHAAGDVTLSFMIKLKCYPCCYNILVAQHKLSLTSLHIHICVSKTLYVIFACLFSCIWKKWTIGRVGVQCGLIGLPELARPVAELVFLIGRSGLWPTWMFPHWRTSGTWFSPTIILYNFPSKSLDNSIRLCNGECPLCGVHGLFSGYFVI